VRHNQLSVFLRLTGRYSILWAKEYKNVAGISDDENYTCRYTGSKPPGGWKDFQFDEKSGKMKNGIAPFGSTGKNVLAANF